jgi:hypothetical protein
MISYSLEWPNIDIRGAVLTGFSYIENMDEIVGFITARPEIVKKILFAFPEEFKCDFIPSGGVGILRTAYVLYRSLKWNEIRFVNREKTIELQVLLVDNQS